MAIDISQEFKAKVKSIRMESGDDSNKDFLNDDLLSKSKSKSSISKEARIIVNLIL